MLESIDTKSIATAQGSICCANLLCWLKVCRPDHSLYACIAVVAAWVQMLYYVAQDAFVSSAHRHIGFNWLSACTIHMYWFQLAVST